MNGCAALTGTPERLIVTLFPLPGVMHMAEQKQTETKPAGSIVQDPELAAVNKIVKLLNGLKPRARQRVMSYVGDKLEEEAAPSQG